MSPSPGEFSEQPPSVQAPGVGYVPTEDERRVFRECNDESFWYRSLPISAVSMLVTQGLISRGFLTSSSRFGSLPKVAFAGFCGYLAGKVSYMKTCQEKFKRLENSPLGEALRQGPRHIPAQHPAKTSEFSDNVVAAPLNRSAPPAVEPSSSAYSSQNDPREVPFSSAFSESAITGISENRAPEPVPFLEEIPKHKSMTYDELRNKNRETYELAVNQRADTPVRPPPDRQSRNKVKTNEYGDVWEE